MRRIWCFLGLHDWLVSFRVEPSWEHAIPESRSCLRCGRYTEWVKKVLS